jgi:hypothetical protein
MRRFTHYFKGDPQRAHFVAMMQKIIDTTKTTFTIQFDCASAPPCGVESYV